MLPFHHIVLISHNCKFCGKTCACGGIAYPCPLTVQCCAREFCVKLSKLKNGQKLIVPRSFCAVCQEPLGTNGCTSERHKQIFMTNRHYIEIRSDIIPSIIIGTDPDFRQYYNPSSRGIVAHADGSITLPPGYVVTNDGRIGTKGVAPRRIFYNPFHQ
jgi:hypothetical protein